MLKKLMGLLTIIMGVGLLGWIGYNLLIEMQPAAKGKNPVFAIITSLAFIYVGQKWLRNKKQEEA